MGEPLESQGRRIPTVITEDGRRVPISKLKDKFRITEKVLSLVRWGFSFEEVLNLTVAQVHWFYNNAHWMKSLEDINTISNQRFAHLANDKAFKKHIEQVEKDYLNGSR